MAEKDIFGFGKYERMHAKFASELKTKYTVISIMKTILSIIFLGLMYFLKHKYEELGTCTNTISWWDFWGLLIAILAYRIVCRREVRR